MPNHGDGDGGLDMGYGVSSEREGRMHLCGPYTMVVEMGLEWKFVDLNRYFEIADWNFLYGCAMYHMYIY